MPRIRDTSHFKKSVKTFLKPKEKNPKNIEEPWTNLKGEWEKIFVDECKTLICSCSKRCQAVVESKGQHIKY